MLGMVRGDGPEAGGGLLRLFDRLRNRRRLISGLDAEILFGKARGIGIVSCQCVGVRYLFALFLRGEFNRL